MINLLLLLAASIPYAKLNYAPVLPRQQTVLISQVQPIFNTLYPLPEIKAILHNEAPTLSDQVIDKVLTTLQCSQVNHINHNNILTIIDFSLPSNQKRLWIFDLTQKKLLFHTYVSHGIKSGELKTQNFSNKFDSKASSIGVYTTEKPYYGKEGLSLRLNGLDRGFNDNASNRYIVMHGGWYVDESFIQKYGRPGRSWGCPSVPLHLIQPIIDTIKENSLYVMYYPNDNWFAKSRFLNCQKPAVASIDTPSYPIMDEQIRETVLFADLHNKNKREDNAPILAMPADRYQQIFHTSPPVGRMLRRQINNMEYIALSDAEFKRVMTDNSALSAIYFVQPDIKMVRGYYVTQMKPITFGKIKSVVNLAQNNPTYMISFEDKPSVKLIGSNQFVRWVGL